MSNRVLFDGLNLSLSQGTGIATYAKSLMAAADELGYRPEILISSNAGFDKRDPVFSEIALFDPVIADHPSPKIRLQLYLTRWFGRPFGVRPSSFQPMGGIVMAGRQGRVARTHAAPNVFEHGRLHFRRHKRLMEVKHDRDPDLFHATYAAPLLVKGARNIYTIHDLIPLLLPFTTLDDKKYLIELLRTICREADHIVTVSEHSKRDIIRILGIDEARVTNTYQAVTLPEGLMMRDVDDIALEIESAFGVSPGEYFLFVGAIEPKKNLRRLIDAYAASGSNRPLVVVGGLGWQYQEDLLKLAEDRFTRYRFDGQTLFPERKVRHLSYLPRSQLLSLVRGARALLFPSLYEGFGLPVLEAMMLGTAVLTSNVASLPEIVGEAGLLVDPRDETSIAKGIRALDQDDGLVSTLVARGVERARSFSQQAYAARLGRLYAGLRIAPAERAGKSTGQQTDSHAA